MSKLNEHGVFTICEVVIIADDPKLKVKVLLSEYEGFWYTGCEYQKGLTSVGDYGGGYHPAANSSCRSNSREQALKRQLKKMEKYPTEVAEAVKRYCQPFQRSLF